MDDCAEGKQKFLVELFTKSSWGYGGNAPVTFNNKKYKIRSGHKVKSAIWYGSTLSADAGRLSQKLVPVYICTYLCRCALTCDSIETAFRLYRFLFFILFEMFRSLRRATRASLWTGQLLKKLTKLFVRLRREAFGFRANKKAPSSGQYSVGKQGQELSPVVPPKLVLLNPL